MQIKSGIYKHFKGLESLVVATAKPSDEGEEVVVYFGMKDKTWHTRPVSSFCEKVKDAEDNDVPRFALERVMSVKELASMIDDLSKTK